MFIKKISKAVAMALTIVAVGGSIPNNIYAAEQSSKIDNYNLAIGNAAEQLEEYVYLENNQYILDIPKDVIKHQDKEQLNLYSEYIDTMNRIIIENDVKDVTLENGFTLEISDAHARDVAIENGLDVSDEEISTYAGISKFQWVTGGFNWWLTSFQAGIVIAGAGGGAAYLCSLIPGVGWAAAASIASAMITFAAAYGTTKGVKITYRFNKYLKIYPQ